MSDVILNVYFVVTMLFLAACLVFQFKRNFTNPHNPALRILSVRGFAGYFGLFNSVLVFATEPDIQDWFSGVESASPVPVLCAVAFIGIVSTAIWASPKGFRIESSDGLKWFSDGRRLSVHLDNDASYDVTKDSVKKCAAMLHDKMQVSNMPLFIATPLNIDGILREMRKEFGVNVRDKIRLPTCWVYLKSIAFKRSQKSNITKWQAFKKSIMSRRVVISR